MSKKPDYNLATNKAYETLKLYYGSFPKINVYEIIRSCPDIRLHPYTEVANRFNLSYFDFLRHVESDHGFTIYNKTKNVWIICYNNFKDEYTLRFTLAHELGHVVLKHEEDNEIARCEADCFARNLLCPVPLREGLGIKTVSDYCNCFGISEHMASITKEYESNDSYYITKENYNMVNQNIYGYFLGYTPKYLYGI
ncbi:MAG: ImmA/IrrE family metallo-endopeptidase [Bacteroides sp.]|nr:ImmA/IrrE family metallo-endopeptidase [Eubacterium sp.]MCM1419731.1 ImmA/IrrE family metallo-endopeptidase [Roseburia sp.]MCM1463706.1 ImmA/IrrE family metallo-endopeptidase [Bacteroides sp.]